MATQTSRNLATPQLASAGLLVRPGGEVMLLRHAVGPFAGRWSMPIVGVAEDETAEDALARLLRDILHVEPGPFEFVDTFNLEGADGARFVLNAFSCVDWGGSPALSPGLYDEAAWVPPSEATAPGSGLDLVPEVRAWIAAQAGEAGASIVPAEPFAPAEVRYDAQALMHALAETRGALLAAYDAVPIALRQAHVEGAPSPLDALAHAADLEVYTVAEAQRILATPGEAWLDFNERQWTALRASRPPEPEPSVRARLETAREATRAWLVAAPATAVNAFADHPTAGMVRVGAVLAELAYLERAAAEGLLRMALASTLRPTSRSNEMDDEGRGN